MKWRVFATTKDGRRVNTLFESLSPNRSAALLEAKERYAVDDLWIHPEPDR
tara:strand:+ start:9556 stop:9708 length:153 start_codon:yes stop_codon:yes gene_type:complete